MERDYLPARAEMVERQLRANGIRDSRVLQAARDIPREEFIPANVRDQAYDDTPVAIGFGQTISQPYMVALMSQTLELDGSEKVLDVGSGSGYQAALFGQLAATVVSIEIIPELAEYARGNLDRTGLGKNVIVLTGDGSVGVPEYAPFDAIAVAAGAPDVPPRLLEQLGENGRLVMPVGSIDDQELRFARKRGGAIETRMVTLCRFVLLRGDAGWRQ